jgi:hypothetical protein
VKDWEEQEQRIIAVVGEADIARRKGFKLWHQHLTSSLSMPFEVTGSKTFDGRSFTFSDPEASEGISDCGRTNLRIEMSLIS